MFLIAGSSSKREKLDFNQSVVCDNCGQYGRYNVIMEYTYLSLFFIPIFKWNKKYYVKSSCCGSIYSINKKTGDKIADGEKITLKDKDLHILKKGHSHSLKKCSDCSFETREDFQYCPKCGSKFK